MSLDLDVLRSFRPGRLLSESTTTGSIYVLGEINGQQAIVHLQRSTIPSDRAGEVISSLSNLNVFLENQPYFSAHANLPQLFPDLEIKVIYPATETHIKKYTAQERGVVRETPEAYEKVVLPYIQSFPESRVEWVYNILDGIKEADRVLHVDQDPETGFVVVPDLKWDQTSVNALYLTVIVRTKSIKSLRDLTREHIPLLKKIKAKTSEVVSEKFGVEKGKLRMFVHYQPSYYHFHIHVVHIYHEGLAGMTVGQAHLLDDIISLLELSDPAPAASLMAKMTFTYVLGVEHGLYRGLLAHQAGEEEGKLAKA